MDWDLDGGKRGGLWSIRLSHPHTFPLFCILVGTKGVVLDRTGLDRSHVALSVILDLWMPYLETAVGC